MRRRTRRSCKRSRKTGARASKGRVAITRTPIVAKTKTHLIRPHKPCECELTECHEGQNPARVTRTMETQPFRFAAVFTVTFCEAWANLQMIFIIHRLLHFMLSPKVRRQQQRRGRVENTQAGWPCNAGAAGIFCAAGLDAFRLPPRFQEPAGKVLNLRVESKSGGKLCVMSHDKKSSSKIYNWCASARTFKVIAPALPISD